ncbi:MAG: hypothetical protein JWN90_579 [Parcubacteria group bacterium]|nr:hypothetical protein [Parcubacteria group bacterium]
MAYLKRVSASLVLGFIVLAPVAHIHAATLRSSMLPPVTPPSAPAPYPVYPIVLPPAPVLPPVSPVIIAPPMVPVGTLNSGVFRTGNPVITGTSYGLTVVGISIDNGEKMYGSGAINVNSNGTWSNMVTTPLPDGTYNVHLYTYPGSELLASGTITIQRLTPICIENPRLVVPNPFGSSAQISLQSAPSTNYGVCQN